MIISTTENIGRNYEIIGIVKGTTVNSRHIGKDIGASFKTIVGGEIKGYTEMIEYAQKIAVERMTEEAEKAGADAIVGVRLSTSSVMQAASEVTAYGTAVKFI
ncbi:MAG: heavy metal-binding domain-containing protein [Clostridiales bacterium]|nr:heavy metal-binding domain-containing protein [Clostridiales bacterium]